MSTLEKAKTLRKNQTFAEQRLWYYLRGNRYNNLKFKRQKPIDHYIVDFVSTKLKLIIELDGGQHVEQRNYDSKRTEYLEKKGFQVLRFWNNEIMQQLESVLMVVDLKVQELQQLRDPLPQPLSRVRERGEGISTIENVSAN